MRLELSPRAAPSLALQLAAPLVAFAAALLVGGLIVMAFGKSPLAAFSVYFVEPLMQGWSLQEIAVKAGPLVLIACGLAFCFRANVWNIGAEGQFIVGGAIGGWIALLTHGTGGGALGTWWILPAMLMGGALGGLLYAMIPALLRVWLGVSEILTSLMLVYVAELWLDYMVRGPWRDPKGFNFPVTATFEDHAVLPLLVEGGRLHGGVLLALAAVVISTIVLSRSLFGYRVTLAGLSPKAARFAGFSEKGTIIAVLAISGACAGLAGIAEVSGQIGQLQTTISPGYGFTAIIVAFLGRLSPPAILVAGLVLALTYIGGEGAQIALKLPLDMTRTFQGVLLMCVLAADILTRYRIRIVPGRRG